MTPLIFLLIGLVLIFIEFYLPGAILGVSGGILVFVSIVLFAMDNSPLAIVLYIVGVTITLGLMIKFALWRIRTAKPDYSIYSDDSQQGFQASHFDASAIGKVGVVVTDLKPGGHIVVEGKRMQAISQAGYITKGKEIVVIGGQEESLIVKLYKQDTQP